MDARSTRNALTFYAIALALAVVVRLASMPGDPVVEGWGSAPAAAQVMRLPDGGRA